MNKPADSSAGREPLGRELSCELRGLYAELDREVASFGPVCALSGRCCRFVEFGHTLFVSTAEVDFLLAFAVAPSRPLDQGETCPWQDSRGHCTARDARPLGCRTYYCDPSFEEESHRISEHFIDRLKRLSAVHEIQWNYAPLHRHLLEKQREGRYPSTESIHDGQMLDWKPS